MKDVLGIIADMLKKLDQHSEILERQFEALRKQTDALTIFMDGTLKQFEQQQLLTRNFLKG